MLPNGEWIHAKNLSAGTARLRSGGGGCAMKVKRIEYAGKADVFNMEVEDTHSFVIQGGVVSQNCADSIRYFCMMRPIAAPIKEAESNSFDPLDLNKQNLTRRY
jgi:hypothetical protein